MKKIHLVMPMGGAGTRFGKHNFKLPKPLIMLQDKPFFFWAAQSILKYMNVQDLIFVILQEHVDKYGMNIAIKKYYPNSQIMIIPQVLNGAILTCMEGIKNIDDDSPILFNDCDHAFKCRNFYDFCKNENFNRTDGALLTFSSHDPKYSFIEKNNFGNVIKTVEKEAVSDEAICGAYFFKNKNIFIKSTDIYLNNCDYKEFFVSGVYNIMAKNNMIIKSFQVDEHISFGTPEEFKNAENDFRLKEYL